MCIKKNDVIKIVIEGITSEGNGVGRVKNMVVFVPASAIGDELLVRILKVKKNYAFGKIEEILNAAENRIKPDCNQYLKCGGCVYRHISYSNEKTIKEQKVIDALTKIGGLNGIKVNRIIGANHIDRYRNKAQLPIGKNKDGRYELGFFAPHSHRIVDCTDCSLQPNIFSRVADIFKLWLEEVKPSVYNETTGEGILRHLYIRQSENYFEKEIMVCIVANADKLPKEKLLVKYLNEQIPQIKSVIINTNKKKTNVILGNKFRTIWGQDYITDILCDCKFNISPNSFYQVNKAQTENLYKLVKKYANCKNNEILLDLYCGIGTIGITMASNCKKLIGVEIVKEAVEDAKCNAKLNKINNAEFICSDALDISAVLSQRRELPDVVVVDPPRKGCKPELIDTIIKMKPSRIVYVSCNPATLARDLKVFVEKGYNIHQITPVDMFPRTMHVETVVLMLRVNPNK